MTREDVLALAMVAGFSTTEAHEKIDELMHIVGHVQTFEREKCANIVEHFSLGGEPIIGRHTLAHKIRTRGE